MTEVIEHEPYDFLAAASIPTNEQKILATLERIEKLLTPPVTRGGPNADIVAKEATGIPKALQRRK